MNAEVTRRDKTRTFLSAVALAAVVVLLAPPIAEAAKVTVVKVKGAVKVKGSDGTAIESKEIGPMGLLQAEGSDGAIAVRNFAGGGGFINAGDCTSTTADGLSNVVEASGVILTGIIVTGTDGTVTVTSAAIGNNQLPLSQFRVNENNPNEFIGLGNGLTLTAPLTFTCTGSGEGGSGNARFVLLGQ